MPLSVQTQGVWGLLSLEVEAELGQVWTSKGCDILPRLSSSVLRVLTQICVCSAFVPLSSQPSSSPAQVKATGEIGGAR